MSTATAVAERWSPWVGKALLVLAVGAGGLWTATHGVAGVAWSDGRPGDARGDAAPVPDADS